MKYVSIDIETTGLDTENDEILSIGAVVEDTCNPKPIDELPKIHIIIPRERIKSGSTFALNLNMKLISWIVKWNTARNSNEKKLIEQEAQAVFLEEDQVVEELLNFLWKNEIYPEKNTDKIIQKNSNDSNRFKLDGTLISLHGKTYFTTAGKNFNVFDRIFLERLPKWKMVIGRRVRTLDPATSFVDWKNDKDLPGLGLCKKRAGLSDDIISHNAVEDAIDVINILRTLYTK